MQEEECLLTNIQVQYWANQEQKRHNLATEQETYRSNVASLNESIRHNIAGEQLSSQSLAETIRSNKARESLSVSTLNESIRHNKRMEDLQSALNDSNIALNSLRAAGVELENANMALSYSKREELYPLEVISTGISYITQPLKELMGTQKEYSELAATAFIGG